MTSSLRAEVRTLFELCPRLPTEKCHQDRRHGFHMWLTRTESDGVITRDESRRYSHLPVEILEQIEKEKEAP